MQATKFYFLVCSVLFLSGCGDENSTAGVSLGGSGTGYPQPQPPIDIPTVPNPSPPIEPSSPNEPPLEPTPPVAPAPAPPPPPPIVSKLKFVNPGVVKQRCEGIERSIQFESIETGELLEENVKKAVLPQPNTNSNNMAVRMSVCNVMPEARFEHVSSCTSPVKLLDFKGDVMPAQANFTCSSGESLVVYQPSECKVSRYEFAVPTHTAQWYLSYESSYSNKATQSNLNSCLPMIYRFSVVAE
ncbi:hypothetical protein [Alkanindiges illinoisensis]|uniref:hypothetical protein n=1 Tax=Alkanindiges illinoisensis TaxID=197183 RepID=UPI00047BE580|nr:hypothetical protein [Alkanindiges illinoisensis]